MSNGEAKLDGYNEVFRSIVQPKELLSLEVDDLTDTGGLDLNPNEYLKSDIKDKDVDRWLRIILAIMLVLTVCLINGLVFYFISKAMAMDELLISTSKMDPADRLINSTVFLALITAVAAEITPVLFAVVKYIFSVRSKDHIG
ncbi:hypothetical protein [Oceanisphaera sp. IT1-181]|uniref:hypothetical protein n=1 Tax=Oceanisphaera sp. IT1-181 TaxID=3081199 RepID=UPI0029CA7642|nr:hypothetical protein [Oceanisphaera sp. IT1-181]